MPMLAVMPTATPSRTDERPGRIRADDPDRELVPAEAREHAVAPEGRRQPCPDLGQQLVTHVVAQAVVDLLEAIEVEQEQGVEATRFSVASGARGVQVGVDAGVERTSVRQPGQVVGGRLPPELPLGAAPPLVHLRSHRLRLGLGEFREMPEHHDCGHLDGDRQGVQGDHQHHVRTGKPAADGVVGVDSPTHGEHPVGCEQPQREVMHHDRTDREQQRAPALVERDQRDRRQDEQVGVYLAAGQFHPGERGADQSQTGQLGLDQRAAGEACGQTQCGDRSGEQHSLHPRHRAEEADQDQRGDAQPQHAGDDPVPGAPRTLGDPRAARHPLQVRHTPLSAGVRSS
jgi:hypothetical protein